MGPDMSETMPKDAIRTEKGGVGGSKARKQQKDLRVQGYGVTGSNPQSAAKDPLATPTDKPPTLRGPPNHPSVCVSAGLLGGLCCFAFPFLSPGPESAFSQSYHSACAQAGPGDLWVKPASVDGG